MTRFLLSASLLTSILFFAVPVLSAQTSPKPPVTEPIVAAPDTPVVPEPVPQTVPAPTPTPPVIAPPSPIVKQPPLPPKKAVKKTGPGDKLKPGQYIWENRAAYKNPLRIIVVLDFQRLYVFDGEELVAFTTISTGKKGHETPAGVFKILQKEVEHYSNLYNNAPMPFMQRLTWDGVALHAGKIPGYPASHGCIRLPAGFAKSLFGVTKLAQEVIVIRDTSAAGRIRETPNEQSKGGGEAGVVSPPVEAPVETPPTEPPATPPNTEPIPSPGS